MSELTFWIGVLILSAGLFLVPLFRAGRTSDVAYDREQQQARTKGPAIGPRPVLAVEDQTDDEWIAEARGSDPAFAAAHKALPPMHGMSRLADMLGGWECLCGRGSWTTYGCTTGEDDLEGAAESIAIAAPVEVPLRPWAYGGWVDVDGHKLHRSCVVSAVGSQADRVCAHCGPVLAVAS
jgi:hypothetical protein